MSNLIETKSLLAKLMATENIHIEQRNVSTASFDVSNRVLTVPVLNNNIDADTYDLFMGHEVGHALYTPYDEMKKAFESGENMSVINVVDDSRIERKIKYKYPGLKNAFIRAYKGLFERDFFRTAGKDLNDFNLIDRINLHCKIGASLNIQFNDKERELLNAVESTQTYDEVIKVQRQIIEYMKENSKEEDDDFEIPDFGDEESDDLESMPMPMPKGTGEQKDDEGTQSEDELDSEEESEDEHNSDPNSKGADESEDSTEEKDEGEKETKSSKGAGTPDEPIRSLTDEAFKQNEHKLFNAKAIESLYLNAPKVNLNDIIVDYKELYKMYDSQIASRNACYYVSTDGYDNDGFVEMRNGLNKSVSYLVKEFELRKNAEQMKKASTAKTGDLDLKKIFSYQYNEDIFKKLTVTNQGKSHGLVMFIDWSGSMQDHLYNTVKQLFNMVMFCKKVNIPYEVYAFSDYHGLRTDDFIQEKRKNDLIVTPNLRLLNILSSRMNASQFSKAASALVYVSKNMNHGIQLFTLGGTPLNDTILAAMEVVPEFQKKNNLQIVNTVFLTDGDSNGNLNMIDENLHFKSIYRSVYVNGRCYRQDIVIRDTVTRHEIKVSSDSTSDYTAAYIKLLKLRTNSNIIGFYILSNYEAKRSIYKFFPNKYEEYDKLYSDFKKNKHLVVTSQGYDEYYLLRSDKFTDDEDDTFEVRGKTTKSIVNAFSKFTCNKMNSRTVLNRFIGLIS